MRPQGAVPCQWGLCGGNLPNVSTLEELISTSTEGAAQLVLTTGHYMLVRFRFVLVIRIIKLEECETVGSILPHSILG